MDLPVLSPTSDDVCVDTQLRLVFDSAPCLTGIGMIKVLDTAASVVQTIDLADPASYRRSLGAAVSDRGETHLFNDFPVIISDSTATIVLRQPLDYAQTYSVLVDPDVFVGFPGITDRTAWTFSTKSERPTPQEGRLLVAGDGSGDFATVQGAIDAVPLGNHTPVLIDVAPGRYLEIIYLREDRPFITVRGADRLTTMISYPNNNVLNGQASDSHCPRRRLGDRDLHNGWRATFGVDAPHFTLENITVENTTPAGGSQAEAFRGNNDAIVLNRVRLIGHQDTLRLQGKAFVTNSLIVGDVDFVWGTGSVFHSESEFRSAGPGYLMQIRNGSGEFGHVVVNSRLTRDPGVPDATVHLARTDVSAFPYSQAIFVNTEMDAHIRPEGWLVTPSGAGASDVQFSEYASFTSHGVPLVGSDRASISTQVTAGEAARWSDPAYVLDGWVPLTVNVDRATATGSRIRVNWTAPPGHLAEDELLLVPAGDHSTGPELRRPVASKATTGVQWFPVPDGGPFRIAYRPRGESAPAAYSEEFHVAGHGNQRPVATVNTAVAQSRSAEIHSLPEGVVGVDVEKLITIRSSEEVAVRRDQLINYVFKGPLPTAMPDIAVGVSQPDLMDLRHGRIDAVTSQLPYAVVSTAHLVWPVGAARGPLALYFAGHGNPRSPKYHRPQLRAMQALLDRGYVVAAVDMPFLGWNSPWIADPLVPGRMITPEDHRIHEVLADYESSTFSAIRFFVEPAIQLLNHAADVMAPESDQGTVAVGFSGGAWTTTVLAAIDDRITHSYPVAGSSPFYLRPYPREKSNVGDWEQRRDSLPDFYALAGYLDLYLLGAAGRARSQLQVLNRFDPVCFAGVGHRSYAPVVEQRVATLGGGSWQVLDDPTHGEHQVSPYALSAICWDLDARSRRSQDDQAN